MDLVLERWTDFNVAMVGATAALVGLVIVAVSVNVSDVVKSRSLTARLAAVIATLVVALAGSAIALIPDVASHGYGLCVALLGAVSMVFHAHAVRQIYATPARSNWLQHLQALVGALAPLAFMLGGLLLIAGNPAGLLTIACASILAIAYTVGIAWIALIEVLR